MARPHLTPGLARTQEAVIMLFCIVDDAYHAFNPRAQRYESLKQLSDSEVLTLALLQQLRGVESERSFLREVERFFSHLFQGVVGLWPSSLNRQVPEDRPGYDVLPRFRESAWDGKIGLGVIDIHTDYIETPELVRDRILYASEVLGPERIEVNTDCGLRTRTWEVSLEKMKNMVEGTRLAEVALNGS